MTHHPEIDQNQPEKFLKDSNDYTIRGEARRRAFLLESACGLVRVNDACYKAAEDMVLIHPTGFTPYHGSLEAAAGTPPDMDGENYTEEEEKSTLIDAVLCPPSLFTLFQEPKFLDLADSKIPEENKHLLELIETADIQVREVAETFFF